MNKDEYIIRRKSIDDKEKSVRATIQENMLEEQRTIRVLHNAGSILDELDRIFEERTSLDRIDYRFLMFATALQLIRIYLLPQFEEKIEDDERLAHNDDSIKQMERERVNEYKKEHIDKWESIRSEKKYRTWQEIAFTIKVPYDSTKHSGEGFNNINMRGGKHRFKTLGHDPWLGWIFGVANIISDSITICPEYKLGEKKFRVPLIETYEVDMMEFAWRGKESTALMFNSTFESIKEDRHRLYAAVFSQGLHLESDKFTKNGLQVPLLSLIDSDKAYEIYSSGYDYLDFEFDLQLFKRASKSAAEVMIINAIIGAIHNLFYNPSKEPDRKLYATKTHKIIMYSNLLATSSDVIHTAINISVGNERAIENFDLGGFLVTLSRLVSDVKFIQQVKEEFIFREWDKIMKSNNNILNI